MGMLDTLLKRNNMEKQYSKELGNAFRNRRESRGLLLDALVLYNEDAFAKALEILTALLAECDSDDDYRAVLLFSALCRTDSGDDDGAIADYRRLLQYAPSYSTALSNLGLLLMKHKAYAEAEPCLVAAEKSDPKNAYAKHNLGTLYFRMGDYEKAATLCTAAFLHNQSLYQACTTVCLCAMAMGELSISRRYAQLAVQRGQNEAVLQRSLQNAAARQFVDSELSLDLEHLMKQWLRRTVRKSNLLYVTPEPVGSSYIGGPALGEPPLDQDGNPMRQLCAIFCNEFQDVPILPKEGLLRIFISAGDVYGLNIHDPTAQTGFRVLYDREYDHLLPGDPPAPDPYFPIQGCYGIRPAPAGNQPMPMEDYRFRHDFPRMLTELGRGALNDDEIEAITPWLNSSGHRMGGYPWFTQGDPRENKAYRKYDTLLFQLDNMDFPGMKIHIGDFGVMNFFIPEENLKKLDFSDVLYWWDCC